MAYHDACHLAHGQQVRAQPRELLRRIPGLTLVDLKDSRSLLRQRGGLQSCSSPTWPSELGRRRSTRIRETGARIVAAGNPGCLMQIAQHCRAPGLDVEVVHPVTLLARALRGRMRSSVMKIAVEDHVEVRRRQDGEDRARHDGPRASSTSTAWRPGQSQKPHTHDDQDKIYYVLEGSGRFSLGGKEERLPPGEALVAPAGVEHGLVNDGDRAAPGPGGGHAAAAAQAAGGPWPSASSASLMITCLGRHVLPRGGRGHGQLLRRLGVTVDFPEGQTCCGMPLFNSGYHGEAARVAARTVELFERAEHVVVPSGSCAWMVKDGVPGAPQGRSAPATAAAGARRRGRCELSQFLVEVLGVHARRVAPSRAR